MAIICPALIIGIGGTGKAAVANIRSRIIAKFGSLDALKVVNFLVLDTDIAASDLVKDEGDLFGSARVLSEDEHVYLNVQPEKMTQIKEGLHDYFPYYKNWLNIKALDTPQISGGASQIRQRGRLAFYEHYDSIATAVNTGIKNAISENSINRTTQDGRTVDDKQLFIYVIGSLIGGTGAGIFIDMGYLIQKVVTPDSVGSRKVERMGVFVLPPAEKEIGENVETKASSYAALMEFNHYSDISTNFNIITPDGVEITSSQPAYQYTYLVTNQNLNTGLNSKKLLEMIGQKVFMDTTSEFSVALQSSRNNLAAHLPTFDKKECNQFYLTFGISTIEIPVHTVINTCAAKFLKDTFGELKYGPYEERNIEIDKKYRNQTLTANSMSEQEIIKTLKAYDGTDITAYINSRIEQVDTIPMSTLLKELSKLEQEFEAKFKVKGTDVVGSTEGEFARKVRENYESFMKQKSEANIEKTVNDLCNNPERRIKFASVFLDSIKEYYDSLYQKYLKDNEKFKNRIAKAKKGFPRIKGGAALIANDWLLLFWKGIVIKDFLNRVYKERAKKYFGLLTEYLVNIYMLDITRNINKTIDKQREKLSSLELYVEERLDEFETLRGLAKESFVAINGLQLFPKEDGNLENFINRIYNETIGDKEDKRNRLKDFISAEVSKFIQKDNSELDIFLLKKSTLEKDKMKDSLYIKAKEKVATHGQLEQLDVIKMFYEQYSQELENKFREVHSLSSPFLLLNTTDPKYSNHPGKSQNTVAFYNAEKSEQAFKELCRRRIAHFDKIKGFGNIEEKYQVIFFQEYGAFPIRIWRSINKLKERYEKHIRDGGLPIHNEKKDFDYLPIDKPAPEDIKKIEKLLLIATVPGIDVFEISDTRRDGRLYQLEYYDEDGIIRTLQLKGVFEKLSYQLLDKERDLKAIEDRIFRSRNDMGDENFAFNIRDYLNGGLRDAYCNKEKKSLFERYQEYILEYLEDNGLKDMLESSGIKAVSLSKKSETVEPPKAEKTLCPHCKAEVKSGKKFCGECGKTVEPPKAEKTLCPHCKAEVKSGKKFCGECGKTVEPPKAEKTLCPHCKAEVKSGKKFCGECGKTVEPPKAEKTLCPHCKAEVKSGKKFCGECGESVAEVAKPLKKICPHCNIEIAPAKKFCGECGYSFNERPAGVEYVG